MDDLEITALITRLSRPHSSGGVVIERAAIAAAGVDFPAVIDWIATHGGRPDETGSTTRDRGLHGSRTHDGHSSTSVKPPRFVLPVGTVPDPFTKRQDTSETLH
jgi:hypothetical protein